jgi:hypothetical protein
MLNVEFEKKLFINRDLVVGRCLRMLDTHSWLEIYEKGRINVNLNFLVTTMIQIKKSVYEISF